VTGSQMSRQPEATANAARSPRQWLTVSDCYCLDALPAFVIASAGGRLEALR